VLLAFASWSVIQLQSIYRQLPVDRLPWHDWVRV
jgi:hypothetical protein